MMAQNYPTLPNQMNNTAANLMTPYPQPPPLVAQPPVVVAPANQVNMAAKNMESNIIHNQKEIYQKQEIKRLETENQKLHNKIFDEKLKHIEEKIDRANTQNNNNKDPNIIIIPGAGGVVTPPPPPVMKDPSGRLKMPQGSYCLYLCLNIFLPGVGTLVAACQYGNTPDIGDRTNELICHGIGQICSCILIFGWIWAILEATRHFEKGVCGC